MLWPLLLAGFALGVLGGLGPRSERATNRRLELSIIAPGRWAARMAGIGTLRRSSAPAQKKVLWVSRELRPPDSSAYSFVFPNLAMIGFLDLHGKESLTKRMANWVHASLRSRSSHKALSTTHGCDHRLVAESDAEVGYEAPSVRIFD
jgi:hypothetical protein